MKRRRTAPTFYSNDFKLESRVMVIDSRIFVDFYKGETLVETMEVTGHSISYAEDMAENYVLGILKIDTEKMEI